uniref:Photosystem I reaction center subunit III n=1 Tax=Lotharella globosa TaxID=91324 RepID=A0A7S3Y8B8_9EUKA
MESRLLLASVLVLQCWASIERTGTFRSTLNNHGHDITSTVNSRHTKPKFSLRKRHQRVHRSKNLAMSSISLATSIALLSASIGQKVNADVAGLVKCSENPAFAKRKNKEMKSLEKALAKYEAGSPSYEEISSRIERTKARFDKYGRSSLLCGPDGLPHLIVAPEFAGHAGEFLIPAIAFLYINGWIGWVGRSYLRWNKMVCQGSHART